MRWLDSRGWQGADKSSLAETSETEAKAQKAPDLRESFGLGPLAAVPAMSERETPFFRDNIWPDKPAEMRPVFEAYYREMETLSTRILEIFAAALGLPQKYFADKNDRHLSHLVINHYPAQVTAPKPNQIRAGAHTDFGDLTILYPDAKIGGLQVCDSAGVWRDVSAPPEAFIVNLGDLMAQWSNGQWISSLHRVVNPPAELANQARQSLVFFHQPNWHAEIRALPGFAAEGEKFAPTTSGAHYEAKLRMLGGVAPEAAGAA
jgi:isopenicillin N synthase-like dioxygenase